jgi:hypothetical protein
VETRSQGMEQADYRDRRPSIRPKVAYVDLTVVSGYSACLLVAGATVVLIVAMALLGGR